MQQKQLCETKIVQELLKKNLSVEILFKKDCAVLAAIGIRS